MLGQNKISFGIKQLTLFGAVFGLIFATGAVSFNDAFASGGPKIDICYKGKDKEVKPKKVPKFLAKGASLGECDDDDDDDDKKKHGKGKFKHVLRGDGPPPKKLGKIGDLYFDTNNDPNSCMDFYVKVNKTTWQQRGTLCDIETLEEILQINWDQINDVPEGLEQLAALDCGEGEIAKTNSSGEWICAADNDTLHNLDCTTDQIARWNGSDWVCSNDERGDLVITTVRTIFGNAVGADVEMGPISPASETQLTGSCGSNGVIVGYDLVYPDVEILEVDIYPFTVTTLEIIESGTGIKFSLHNIGVRASNGDVIIGNLEAIELILFCALSS